MKVKDVMTANPKAIWLTESLADAAKEMWEHDCGVLPIIKDGLKVVGMITDRDICMATALKDRSPSSISVEEVMNGVIYSTEPEQDIEVALATMREHKVRRLPVLNANGEVEGMLSINDIVLKAKASNGKKPEQPYSELVKTLQAICSHSVNVAEATAG